MSKLVLSLLVGTSLISCSKKDKAASEVDLAIMESHDTRSNAVESDMRSKSFDPGEGAAMALEEGAAGAPSSAKADGHVAMKHATSAGVMGSMAAPAPAAGVKAGEWDDNANYREFVKWMAAAPQRAARLDVRNRQFVVITDKDGKPVPNCTIAIADKAQHEAKLVTSTAGRAIVFPRALGLDGKELTVTSQCGAASGTIDASANDGVTTLKLASARALPAHRTIDLAFVLDTTGSMSEEIGAVKSTIQAVAEKLGTDQIAIRIGLVEYKDREDTLVTKAYPFSSDVAAFGRTVAHLSASGGGDTPEDMQAGIETALKKLDWSSESIARLVFVIADAPPHVYQQQQDYATSAKQAASRGIKLFTVSASGMDDFGQIVMRQLAQYTGASNMFVLRGGAGPQSTGGGDPEKSCGGTHDNYSSGNLHELILAKVRQELAALDGNPMAIAGRGQDEKAKPCKDRIAIAQ